MQEATFGAGCFWGVQYDFDQVNGVVRTTAGYMGGSKENPTYEEVCSNTTGHAEVVHLEFDENIVTYEELLNVFWKMHDPTQKNRQGVDIGLQYRSVIFYHTAEQKKKAEESKQKLEESEVFKKPIATQIEKASIFYPAEEYHQEYFKKNGVTGCRI